MYLLGSRFNLIADGFSKAVEFWDAGFYVQCHVSYALRWRCTDIFEEDRKTHHLENQGFTFAECLGLRLSFRAIALQCRCGTLAQGPDDPKIRIDALRLQYVFHNLVVDNLLLEIILDSLVCKTLDCPPVLNIGLVKEIRENAGELEDVSFGCTVTVRSQNLQRGCSCKLRLWR